MLCCILQQQLHVQIFTRYVTQISREIYNFHIIPTGCFDLMIMIRWWSHLWKQVICVYVQVWVTSTSKEVSQRAIISHFGSTVVSYYFTGTLSYRWGVICGSPHSVSWPRLPASSAVLPKSNSFKLKFSADICQPPACHLSQANKMKTSNLSA